MNINIIVFNFVEYLKMKRKFLNWRTQHRPIHSLLNKKKNIQKFVLQHTFSFTDKRKQKTELQYIHILYEKNISPSN